MTFELIVKKVIQACFFLEENIAKIRSVFSLKDLEKYLGFCRLPSWLLKLKCSLTESLLCLCSSWCQKLLLHCGPGQVATRDGSLQWCPIEYWIYFQIPLILLKHYTGRPRSIHLLLCPLARVGSLALFYQRRLSDCPEILFKLSCFFVVTPTLWNHIPLYK